MSDKFKLAIIGAGIFAEANHFPSLSLHFFDDIERAAVCDLDINRAERLADKYGWKKVYTDFHKMLDEVKPDAVFVCLGAKHHPAVASEVIRAGFPVFLEKPAAINVEGTRQISDVASSAGVPVQVGHQKRHGLAYNKLREHVSNTEEFGNIIQIDSKMHGFTVFPTFYTCMLEWQCHNLDLVISIAGSIKEINAISHRDSDRTGALSALLRFENNALGTLSWGTYGGPGQFVERVEVLSDKGKRAIITNAREVQFCDIENGTHWTNDWNPISPNQSHVFNGYVGEFRHFIDIVKNGGVPVPSIQDELKTMENLRDIALSAGIPIEWAPVSSGL